MGIARYSMVDADVPGAQEPAITKLEFTSDGEGPVSAALGDMVDLEPGLYSVRIFGSRGRLYRLKAEDVVVKAGDREVSVTVERAINFRRPAARSSSWAIIERSPTETSAAPKPRPPG